MTSPVPAGLAEAGLASNGLVTAAVDRHKAAMVIRRTIDADKNRTSWGLPPFRRLEDSCGRYVLRPENARIARERHVTGSPTRLTSVRPRSSGCRSRTRARFVNEA